MGMPQVAGQASAVAGEIAKLLTAASRAPVSGVHAAQ